MARSIDGFVYAPKYGKDIATIYSFYDVYIDRGLQQFIRRLGFMMFVERVCINV